MKKCFSNEEIMLVIDLIVSKLKMLTRSLKYFFVEFTNLRAKSEYLGYIGFS